MSDSVVTKPSALETLKSLSQKKPSPNVALSVQVSDPAISGAKMTGSTVTLGSDPTIVERARQCAELKVALERATSEFAVLQSELRDYGADKRRLYNDTFKAKVTTMKVPYVVETPSGQEVKSISVVCSNKYSVQVDVVRGNRDIFGDSYERLFVEEKTKKLKPNAEELVRGILSEMGLTAEQVDTSMDTLFDEEVKVKTAENFEQEAKKVPDATRLVLDQAVKRSEPSLRFND